MLAVYGNKFLSPEAVFNWVGKSSQGHSKIVVEDCSDRRQNQLSNIWREDNSGGYDFLQSARVTNEVVLLSGGTELTTYGSEAQEHNH
ncbi:hypothetical protein TNCV_451671 [Trichonephila clavipes]|nr:hypothetical protein TNCV_451671 [Trichonephila clavipes]